MPTSKTSYKRRMKLKKKRVDTNKWAARKVVQFNALPEEAKLSLLSRWSGKEKVEETEDE